jgi:CubicO group peptidase (beta-lactamase class C family)
LTKRIKRGEIRNLDSLLIVRNGHLVLEQYFRGWGPTELHTLQSDTKSITSLLVGIAVGQGKISSVEGRAVDFFSSYRPIANLDSRKEAMRVRDLLTMRTGMAWSEGRYEGSPLQRMNECQCDWLRFVVDWPMGESPGSRFEYNSGGTIMLGGILQSATGMRVENFARLYLFEPLGITDFNWFPGEGNTVVHTGGGLNLRPRDMAKIGYLLLRKGRWANEQIVPEAWIDESMRRRATPWRFGSHTVDYGYLWWLLKVDETSEVVGSDNDIYTASGAQGQWIFAIPRYDMVVVVTGSADGGDMFRPVDFLYSDILRAVRSPQQ